MNFYECGVFILCYYTTYLIFVLFYFAINLTWFDPLWYMNAPYLATKPFYSLPSIASFRSESAGSSPSQTLSKAG